MGTTGSFFEKKREWSTLKDQILDYYLTPYLGKILSTKRPTRIGDCFAGKGKFDDGNDGSPLIIARQMTAAVERDPEADLKGVFIEKDYAKELRQNLSAFGSLCIVLEGDYEDRITNFINMRPHSERNYFLYCDPYGIKSVAFKYFAEVKALRFKSLEILLNLNTTGFLREGCRLLKLTRQVPDWAQDLDYGTDRKNTPDHMDDIAGGDYWRSILLMFQDGEIDFHQAEDQFTCRYVGVMQTAFNYVVNIPIKERSHHMPKYRLVFAGDHVDGLFLMVGSMNKAWRSLRESERGGQLYLFDDTELTAIEYHPIRDLVWAALEEEKDLKRLIADLMLEHGIAYVYKEYVDAIRENEGGCFVVTRSPCRTPRGKKATGFNPVDYSITVARQPKQENLF